MILYYNILLEFIKCRKNILYIEVMFVFLVCMFWRVIWSYEGVCILYGEIVKV